MLNIYEMQLINFLSHEANEMVHREVEVDYFEKSSTKEEGYYLCDYDGKQTVPVKLLVSQRDVDRKNIDMRLVCSATGCFYCF